MSYIEREGLLESIGHIPEGVISEYDAGRWDVAQVIKEAPTADVVEVRHGEWIWQFNLDGDDFFECSVCGRQEVLNGLCARRNPTEHFPYCHCGAKMDGKGEGND